LKDYSGNTFTMPASLETSRKKVYDVIPASLFPLRTTRRITIRDLRPDILPGGFLIAVVYDDDNTTRLAK